MFIFIKFIKKFSGSVALLYAALESEPFVKFLDWFGRYTATSDIVSFIEGRFVIPPTNYGYYIVPTLTIIGIGLLMPTGWQDAFYRRALKYPFTFGFIATGCIISLAWYGTLHKPAAPITQIAIRNTTPKPEETKSDPPAPYVTSEEIERAKKLGKNLTKKTQTN